MFSNFSSIDGETKIWEGFENRAFLPFADPSKKKLCHYDVIVICIFNFLTGKGVFYYKVYSQEKSA